MILNTSPMTHQIDQRIPEIDATLSDEWSNLDLLAHIQPQVAQQNGPSARVSARALNTVLGSLEIDAVREHHLTLAMAIIELSAEAASPLPWSHDDPTIALLRAAAKLSLISPEASSSAAALLVDRLQHQA